MQTLAIFTTVFAFRHPNNSLSHGRTNIHGNNLCTAVCDLDYQSGTTEAILSQSGLLILKGIWTFSLNDQSEFLGQRLKSSRFLLRLHIIK